MNSTRITLFILILSLAFAIGHAGEHPRHFSGNARVDLFSTSIRFPVQHNSFVDFVHLSDSTGSNEPLNMNTKSPWLAGVLSLALPGAGEFYAESYLKSGLFFAAEVVTWIVAYTYDKKGDRQTDMFQDYADAHWSAVRYAHWIENNKAQLNPNAQDCSDLVINDEVDWARLNECESELGNGQSNGFTHRLPRRPEQQYYELIGKYPQYAAGWDDGMQLTPDDIVNSRVSARFLDYSAMRGKANDYYNIASTAVSVVVVNHILSAIDAFFTASRSNNAFHAEARMNLRRTPFGAVAEAKGTLKITL